MNIGMPSRYPSAVINSVQCYFGPLPEIDEPLPSGMIAIILIVAGIGQVVAYAVVHRTDDKTIIVLVCLQFPDHILLGNVNAHPQGLFLAFQRVL